MNMMTPSCVPEHLQDAPGCCGNSICNCADSFEDWFCMVREYLYPPIDNLAKGGVFDGMMMAFLKPIWNMYRDTCGMCSFERELNPLTTCCFEDCWAEEFGIPDECFDLFKDICFVQECEFASAQSAQLHARALMEWYGHFDNRFVQMIACQLGLEVTVVAPTPIHKLPDTPYCDIVVDWNLCKKPVQSDCLGNLGSTIAGPTDCIRHESKAMIVIDAAPKTHWGKICDPILEQFCWNPFVDTFKCLIDKLKPCHTDICYRDDYLTADRITDPPAKTKICPDRKTGIWKLPTLKGSGAHDDPFEIDFTCLTQDQITAIACKIGSTVKS